MKTYPSILSFAAVAMLFCFNLFMPVTTHGQITIRGTVMAKNDGKALSGAHILTETAGRSAVTAADGRFTLSDLKPGRHNLKVTFIGYETFRTDLVILRDTSLAITMDPTVILGDEVNIVATRVQQGQPVTYSMISGDEIKRFNLGRDIPFLLQATPSMVTTSDAGNGVGYTAMNIRGTDLTRINVTINGIPVNDAESQGVWFVDLPDLASSTENIQIQRGVGTSTNGAGAFGASVNMKTSDLRQDPYGELDLSGGSYGTFKSTLRFGTGMMAGRITVDGRLSYITSQGYIDRASSNLKSYYLAGAWFGKNTTIKLITFSGFEKTYQAWEGVPKDSLATNRTYNPAGEYKDKDGNIQYYENQTDNYQQDNYQLLFSQRIFRDWNINLALHCTRGRGYYESYDQDASLSSYGLDDVIIGGDTIRNTDLVNRKMMDNLFYGFTFSSNNSFGEKMKLTIGGGWNRYDGNHFGRVIWAEYASNGNNERDWYRNTGVKNDFNIFAKYTYTPVKPMTLFADLQYRYVDYRMNGTLDDLRTIDQVHTFNFINPKAGIAFQISNKHEVYFSFGMANREPSRNNYKDADPDNIPTYETLYDYELGYHFGIPTFRGNVNLYYMNYRNQLALTGEINSVGEAVMVNVPHSYRLGIELSAEVDFLKQLQWNVNATFSINRIKDFTSYVDTYDSLWNFTGQFKEYLGTTNLSFSPGIIAGSILTWEVLKGLSFSLISKYTGKQYIDNTGNASRALKGYFVNNFSANYRFALKPFKEIGITLTVNNLFNRRYESNAWIYQYYLNGSHYETSGYFPQALLNFMAGVTIRI